MLFGSCAGKTSIYMKNTSLFNVLMIALAIDLDLYWNFFYEVADEPFFLLLK